MAQLIHDVSPDLIGLQEVTRISVFDLAGQTLLELDYLDILLAALAQTGNSYAVASSVDNADVALPINLDAGRFGRVVDRDVVMYRVSSTSTARPTSANFDTNFTASIGGTQIEFTRGYTAVDATVRGRTYRFVNTHLEVAGARCAAPSGSVHCQDAQASELRRELAGEPLPTVLLGDFNAAPGSTAYRVIDRQYLDTWTAQRPSGDSGFTCCQAERLLNSSSALSERIDLVFVDDDVNPRVSAEVIGDTANDKTDSGLWPSDHGGVAVLLRMRG